VDINSAVINMPLCPLIIVLLLSAAGLGSYIINIIDIEAGIS